MTTPDSRVRSFAVLLLFAGAGLLLLVGCPQNNPPNAPVRPMGPDSGLVDTAYEYSTSAVDPDGDSIWIRFFWGDTDSTGWLGPVVGGAVVSDSHGWDTSGMWTVSAVARDVAGSRSQPSGALDVVISEMDNEPPSCPGAPTGPWWGYADSSIEFSVWTSDPEEDSVAYRLSWGDEDTSAWSSFLTSGYTFRSSHVWQDSGRFVLHAQARDIRGAVTEWSEGTSLLVRQFLPYPDRVVARFGADAFPVAVALSPDGGLLYVVCSGANNVQVVRTSDYTTVARIPVGRDPRDIVLLPDGKYAYVVNADGNSVTVIRAEDHEVTATVPVVSNPLCIAVHPSGEYVYVGGVPYVTVIRASDNTVVANVDVGRMEDVAVRPDGSRLYAASSSPRRIFVVRTSDYVVVPGITVGLRVEGVAVHPDGEFLFAASRNNRLYVASLSPPALVDSLSVPGSPRRIAILPNGEYAYTSLYEAGSVAVLRLFDYTELARISVGSTPRGIVVHPSGDVVYVVAADADSVCVIGF